MIRLTRLLTAILILYLLPAGPILAAQNADATTLRFAVAPFGSLDPVSVAPGDLAARDLVESLFVGLTHYDPLTNSIQPALARDWTTSDDGLTWTFHLRDDVQWVRYVDGAVQAVRPIVAGDFVYALRRACDSAAPNPIARTVYLIAGCRKIGTTNSLLVDDFFIARELGVKVVNAHTLEVRVLFPAPYLPTLLALPEFRPVPREAVTQVVPGGDWVQPGMLVSSGPFTLSTRDTSGFTLARNPLWPGWNEPGAGNIQQIAVSLTPTPDAIAAAFGGGAFDFARVDPASAAMLPPDRVIAASGPTITVLGFSAERQIVVNDALRRALSLSIDRTALLAADRSALPAWRMTPPAAISIAVDAADNRGFALDLARAALIESKYLNCRLGEPLDFVIDQSPASEAMALAIIGQWQANLGCRPELFRILKMSADSVQRVANGTFSTIRNTDPARPQIWLFTWTPDHADLGAWLSDGVHCRFGYLKSYTACGDADTLIDQAGLERDPAQRLTLYTQAEALLFGQQGTFPVAPLVVHQRYMVRQVWVEGPNAASAIHPARFDLWSVRR